MSDSNAQEPTMEEILASIRRIISEDEAPAAAAPTEAAAPEAPPVEAVAPTPTPPVHVQPAPEPEPPIHAADDEDDILELTEPLDPPTAHAAPEPKAPEPPKAAEAPYFEETVGDLDVFSTKPTAAAPPPAYTPPPYTPPAYDEPLVGGFAAETSASHFGALARTVTMPREGRSLEDVVRELLKPMLRDWLDRNLTTIVEARVQAEVERISRRHDY